MNFFFIFCGFLAAGWEYGRARSIRKQPVTYTMGI
jgi:hypothetical protein